MDENQITRTEEPLIPPAAPVYAAPQPVSYIQPQKAPAEWKILSHDCVFVWIAVLLGILMMRYVVWYADGFFTTLFFLLLYAVSAVYIRKSGCRPHLSQHLFGAVICAFSLVFSLTASPLLHGLCFCFLLPAIIWRTHAICGGAGFVTRYFPLDLCSSAFVLPVQHISAGPQAIGKPMKNNAAAGKAKTILLGLLITVPLTIVVAVLLASADSGIEHMFSEIGNLPFETVRPIFFQILLGFLAGLWLFAVWFSAAQRKKQAFPADEQYAKKLSALRVIPNLGLYAGITPICLLYLIYVISQTSYFLSAFAGRLPDGMIYSEYARRGFFELCAVAVINLLVILVLTGCAKKGGAERPKALTVYACILCLFTLFIIATAVAKMVLYISAYGMTPLRIYTTWFMLLLAAVFLLLLIRQFTAKLHTAAVLTGVFIVMFGGLCFSRPDARIAEYNIRRYAQGTLNDLDVDMLCDLSDDAYNVMARNRAVLERAGEWNTFLSEATYRVNEQYSRHNDLRWNLPAQILIQQIHTDTQ